MIQREPGRPPDRRVRRTRSAIITAFNRLIQERGFASLTPGDVAAAADVGRSTFYEHFAGLDGLLAEALIAVLAPLAAGCFEPDQPADAKRAVAHIWSNRQLARALFGDETHRVVLHSFAGQFSTVLRRVLAASGVKPILDPELIALHLAAGQLAVLSAWLSGRSGHSAADVADALHVSGRASSRALMGLPAG